jgi:hypothetical protein
MAEEAMQILEDSYDILRVHPSILMPLVPLIAVAWLIMRAMFNLPEGEGAFGIYLLLFFLLNLCLFLAFAVTTVLMRRIHQGLQPDLAGAYVEVVQRYGMRILSLTGLWFLLFFFIVFLLSLILAFTRMSHRIARALAFVVGLLMDALNMASFLTIPVIVFEELPMARAMARVHEMARDKARTALAGLVLTRILTIALGLLLGGMYMMHVDPARQYMLILVAVIAWLWGMYLDFLFAVGLYLKTTWPDSPLLVNFRKDEETPLPGEDESQQDEERPGEGA